MEWNIITMTLGPLHLCHGLLYGLLSLERDPGAILQNQISSSPFSIAQERTFPDSPKPHEDGLCPPREQRHQVI